MSEVDHLEDEMLPEYLDWSNAIRGKYAGRRPPDHITVLIEVRHMSDDQWCAGSRQFPGARGFGGDPKSALRQTEALIAEVIEDRTARGEIPPTGLNFAIDYR
jgi:predicted RNase H-like HicB family nuclease